MDEGGFGVFSGGGSAAGGAEEGHEHFGEGLGEGGEAFSAGGGLRGGLVAGGQTAGSAGLGGRVELLQFAHGAEGAMEDALVEALDGAGGGMEGESVAGALGLAGEALIQVGEDGVFDVTEVEVPGGEVGGFELEASFDGVSGIGGGAVGLGEAVLVDGGGDFVFAGVGAVGAGVGGGDSLAGGRAGPGGFLGVRAVSGELAGGDLDERHA